MDETGKALLAVQWGGRPREAKTLRDFGGASVQEIVSDFDGDTYRSVYTVRFANGVYVLHCFQKKSSTGRKTSKPDLDLIKERLQAAEADYQERERST